MIYQIYKNVSLCQVVKKEREQKSLRTNVRKEQELTDTRKSNEYLTFSLLFLQQSFIETEILRN